MTGKDFSSMLIRNSEFLKPFAITLTQDQEDAKDLFQETLYRALANREKFNGGTNIRAWLYTIMRNIFINSYRRKSNKNVAIQQTAAEAIQNMPAPEWVEGNLQSKYILSHIHRLPEIFRYPFLLYFDGYRYHEISHLLKEPLGTVKSRIHFARKMLKSKIER